MATALTSLEIQHLTDRLEAFVEELREAVSGLSVDKLDRDYLQSDEFAAAALAAIEAARHTSHRGKMSMVAGILAGATTIDRPQALDIEAVLTAIRDLSPNSLHLGLELEHLFRENQSPDTYGGAIYPPQWPDGVFLLKRLEAAGLVEELTGTFLDYPGGRYKPTDTFVRVLSVLKAAGWSGMLDT
jgi:hypothetical protein